jgi:hypothetical protein
MQHSCDGQITPSVVYDGTFRPHFDIHVKSYSYQNWFATGTLLSLVMMIMIALRIRWNNSKPKYYELINTEKIETKEFEMSL